MIAPLLRVLDGPFGPTPHAAVPSIGLLALRVGSGLSMLLLHGLDKAQGFASMKDSFPDPLGIGSSPSLGLAVFAEVLCSALLVLGFFTRFAAVGLAITMGVALFLVHANDAWSAKELALVYLLIYTALIFVGPGRFSMDSAILAHGPRR